MSPLLLLALAIGYLLGSIPFGLLLSRVAGLGDLRAIGSGNIGATNVLRTGRRDIAAATLLFDLLKGTAAVVAAAALASEPTLAERLASQPAMAAALGAVVGHLFPVWLGFRGGKGVATFIGVNAGLWWPAALLFAAVWVGTAFAARISSLSALTASLTVPIFYAATGRMALAGLSVVLVALIWLKHLPNIRRLLAGTEPRIGRRT
jgi:glycerol-3-phosphate acyltransferase PlsY